MSPYNPEFTRVYDLVVNEQPEALASQTEMDFITWAFSTLCPRPVKAVLDVGCGKGRHLVPLAEAGYQVTGVDHSPEMLADCQARLAQRGLRAQLIQQDLEQLELDGQFDALICMDTVLGYLIDTPRILSALSRFRRALRPQGLLLLDLWHIFSQWPLFGQTFSHELEKGSLHVQWTEHAEYEPFSSILSTEYNGTWTEKGVAHTFHHLDRLRAMTAGEVQAYLREVGFEQIAAYPGYTRTEADLTESEVLLFTALRPA